MRAWIVLTLLVTTPAFAEPGALPKPGDVVSRVVVEASLARHRMMQPLSVAPDLVVGVRDDLAIAWHHSRMFDGRLGAGNGICLVGARETLGSAPADCDSRYTGAGLSALYSITPAVMARAGVTAVDFSPMTIAASAGAIVGARKANLWLSFAPTLFSGITHRELGNRDRVFAPLYIGATIGRGEIHLRSGFDATLETATETFSVPLGVGGSVIAGGNVRIGGEVTLDRALGMLNGMAWRSASIYVQLEGGRS
jgi:hypothetical protein